MNQKLYTTFMKLSKLLSGKNLGAIPGVRSLHSLAYRNLKPKGIIEFSVLGHRLFADSRDTGMVPYLLEQNIYEPFETELFEASVAPGDVVVDIGANIGYYTLIAARKAGSDGAVFAFEPETGNHSLLLKNIAANGYQNVSVVKKGLAEKPGKLSLHRDSKNLAAATLSAHNAPTRASSAEEIELVTLDDYFRESPLLTKIRLIKMDTQGAEGLIVRGGASVFSLPGLTVFMEFWPYGMRNMGTDPEAHLSLLRSYGFSISLIDEKTRSLRSISDAELMQICASEKDGKQHVNLLLKKN